MRDQADELRSIVLRSARRWTASASPSPRVVVLVGGKGGVGTTTLSLNLAVAAAGQGQRVMLVDADLGRADVSALCRLKERYSLADVLAARRDIHEVLEPGPAGIQILPGAWTPIESGQFTDFARQRFVRGLRDLGPHADMLLVDLGSRLGEIQWQLWQVADEALLITTPDTVSVMDAYATIKSGHLRGISVPIRTVVNQSIQQRASTEAQRRIAASCQRFLNREVGSGGIVRLDSVVADAAQTGTPVLLKCPTCHAARDIERISAALVTRQHTPSIRPKEAG